MSGQCIDDRMSESCEDDRVFDTYPDEMVVQSCKEMFLAANVPLPLSPSHLDDSGCESETVRGPSPDLSHVPPAPPPPPPSRPPVPPKPKFKKPSCPINSTPSDLLEVSYFCNISVIIIFSSYRVVFKKNIIY